MSTRAGSKRRREPIAGRTGEDDISQRAEQILSEWGPRIARWATLQAYHSALTGDRPPMPLNSRWHPRGGGEATGASARTAKKAAAGAIAGEALADVRLTTHAQAAASPEFASGPFWQAGPAAQRSSTVELLNDAAAGALLAGPLMAGQALRGVPVAKGSVQIGSVPASSGSALAAELGITWKMAPAEASRALASLGRRLAGTVGKLLGGHDVAADSPRSAAKPLKVRLDTADDLSATQGDFILLEYSEEAPLLMPEPGMISKVTTWWRPTRKQLEAMEARRSQGLPALPEAGEGWSGAGSGTNAADAAQDAAGAMDDDEDEDSVVEAEVPPPPHQGAGRLATVSASEKLDLLGFDQEFGGLEEGKCITTMTHELGVMPVWRQSAPATDFLLVLPQANSANGKAVLRAMPATWTAGQVEPRTVLHGPTEAQFAEVASAVTRVAFAQAATRLASSASQQVRIANRFAATQLGPVTFKPVCQMLAKSITMHSDSCSFSSPGLTKLLALNADQQQPGDEPLLTPAARAAWWRTRSGEWRMRQLGVHQASSMADLEDAYRALEKLRGNIAKRQEEKRLRKVDSVPDYSSMSDALRACAAVFQVLQTTPWSLTNDFHVFANQADNTTVLSITGPEDNQAGDPSGRGEGFSFIREKLSRKSAKSATVAKVDSENKDRDVDLRTMSKPELISRLCGYGMVKSELISIDRWVLVKKLRDVWEGIEQGAMTAGDSGVVSGRIASGRVKSTAERRGEKVERARDRARIQMRALSRVEAPSDSDWSNDSDSDSGSDELDEEELDRLTSQMRLAASGVGLSHATEMAEASDAKALQREREQKAMQAQAEAAWAESSEVAPTLLAEQAIPAIGLQGTGFRLPAWLGGQGRVLPALPTSASRMLPPLSAAGLAAGQASAAPAAALALAGGLAVREAATVHAATCAIGPLTITSPLAAAGQIGGPGTKEKLQAWSSGANALVPPTMSSINDIWSAAAELGLRSKVGAVVASAAAATRPPYGATDMSLSTRPIIGRALALALQKDERPHDMVLRRTVRTIDEAGDVLTRVVYVRGGPEAVNAWLRSRTGVDLAAMATNKRGTRRLGDMLSLDVDLKNRREHVELACLYHAHVIGSDGVLDRAVHRLRLQEMETFQRYRPRTIDITEKLLAALGDSVGAADASTGKAASPATGEDEVPVCTACKLWGHSRNGPCPAIQQHGVRPEVPRYLVSTWAPAPIFPAPPATPQRQRRPRAPARAIAHVLEQIYLELVGMDVFNVCAVLPPPRALQDKLAARFPPGTPMSFQQVRIDIVTRKLNTVAGVMDAFTRLRQVAEACASQGRQFLAAANALKFIWEEAAIRLHAVARVIHTLAAQQAPGSLQTAAPSSSQPVGLRFAASSQAGPAAPAALPATAYGDADDVSEEEEEL